MVKVVENLISDIARRPDSARGKVIACEQALVCCSTSGEAAIAKVEKIWIWNHQLGSFSHLFAIECFRMTSLGPCWFMTKKIVWN